MSYVQQAVTTLGQDAVRTSVSLKLCCSAHLKPSQMSKFSEPSAGVLVAVVTTGYIQNVTTIRILVTAGGACQFVGVLLVFGQIAGLERALHLRSWESDFVDRMLRLAQAVGRRLPHRRRPNQVVQLSAASASVSSGRGRLVVRPAEGDTVPDRLDAHWRYLNELQQQLDSLRMESGVHYTEHEQRLASLQERLNFETTRLDRLIADVGVEIGDTRTLQVAGALLILLGIVLVTWAGWMSCGNT
jgi:hypothetical protein